MTPPLLQVRGVSKTYAAAGSPALDAVSLTIASGSVTGIVGESGSGKTTLARIMAGLLRPDGGDVIFDGTALSTLRGRALRHLRRHLQYVHQDPAAALDPRFRVRDILHEPLRIHTKLHHAQRHARILALLDAVGLPAALLDRYPHQLSGGQQRRVGLARVLVLEPRLVILDEPTAGLDLLVQASLLALLRDLRERLALTYVVVTHDLLVVEALCQDVVTLFRGCVVEQGPVSAVLAAPSHPYSADLLSAMPMLDGPRVIDQPRWQAVPSDAPPPVEACPYLHRCQGAVPRCAQERPTLVRRGDRDVACWIARSPTATRAVPPPQRQPTLT